MKPASTAKTLLVSAFLTIGLIAPAVVQAVAENETLSIVPQGPTRYDVGEGGGSIQLTFDIVVGGLSADQPLIADFDFGIIYDPAVMGLSSFSGFGNRLGNPAVDSFEALTTDHLDNTNDSFDNPASNATNSTWDYRDPSAAPSLGAYTGLVLGTPDITDAYSINEGSLRFTESTLLTEAELNALQDPATNDSFTLFSLTFNVDTSQGHSTEILIVDDRYYENWDPNQTGGVLDVKYFENAVPRYLTLNGSRVSVPLPGTLMLMLSGLLFVLRLHGRKRIAACVKCPV